MRIDLVGISRLVFGGVIIAAGSPWKVSAQSAILNATGGPALVKTLSDRDAAWQLGGGAERLNGAVGFGGDIDWVHFPADTKVSPAGPYTYRQPSLNMAVATLKGTYHFGEDRSRRSVSPFGAAGLSLMAGENTYGMVLLAGGLDWWSSQHAGIRLEVRGQFPIMLGVRVGMVFR
jgi:hypothetical protein